MTERHTPDTLRAFSLRVAEAFNAGRIRAPVHLSGGNERQLIDIFNRIRLQDWVLTTWRSHYHCLLKGVPEDTLFADVVAGKSITLCYPEHRVLSSAIVGGVCPIAVGVAAAIRRMGGSERVWCFVGDMTARSGVFHECEMYVGRNLLPVTFVVEDNGKSVCTPTEEVWGLYHRISGLRYELGSQTIYYQYELPWPHSGAGIRVEF